MDSQDSPTSVSHAPNPRAGAPAFAGVVRMFALGLALGLGVAIGAGSVFAASLGGVAQARDALQNFLGVVPTYSVEERYRMSVGVDQVGNFLPVKPVAEIRQHYNLPDHYGRLVDIETVPSAIRGEARAVLWYAADDGILRNVLVDPLELVRIQRFATERYEIDVTERESR